MRNTLLVYKGGGYDGCFFEWNSAIWDHEGKFHDIYSSGRSGLFQYDRVGLLKASWTTSGGLCRNTTAAAEDLAFDMIKHGEQSCETIDLTDPKRIAYFARTWAVPFVYGTVLAVNKLIPSKPMFWMCTACNKQVKGDEGTLEGWHGCGGIASTADDLLCDQCHSEGECSGCGDYCGPDFLHSGLCDSCRDSVFASHPDEVAEVDAINADIDRIKAMVARYVKVRPEYEAKTKGWYLQYLLECSTRKEELSAEMFDGDRYAL